MRPGTSGSRRFAGRSTWNWTWSRATSRTSWSPRSAFQGTRSAAAGHRWSALVGARNLRHQYDVRLNGGAQESTRRLDHDWTDALVGLTHAYRFSDSIVWRNVATAGFGESKSYWSWRTALHWQVARSWNVGFYVDYRAIDYEGNDPGDADWYLYDADEWGPGLTVDYTFD